MKKVIDCESFDMISIDSISLDKWYGVCRRNGGAKGFIVRQHFNSGVFNVHSISEMTNGNHFCGFYEKTLRKTIKQGFFADFNIYEFDTSSELFLWLAEQVS